MESKKIKLPSWPEFRFGNRIANKLTRFVESRTPADIRLVEMSSAYEQAQCVYVAAKLKVADRLLDGPKDAETLAHELDVQADPLDRVLRYLSELGVFARDAAGRYSLNSVSKLLVTDHPHSQRDIVLLSAEEAYNAWAGLLDTVKTGENAFVKTYGSRFFDYHQARPERAEVFDRAMVSVSALPDQAVAEDYDFSAFGCLVDLGGGRGNLLKEILKRNPSLRAILFDRPSVLIDEVREQWSRIPLGRRVELQAGDFFEAIPDSADVYILKDVVHNWPDDKVLRLYKNLHGRMAPEAILLLAEPVILDGDPMKRVKLNLDVNMLVIHSGKERTEEQHRHLLAQAGFELTRIVPTRSLMSVVEARRA